jgi:hypothetical protein
MLRALHSNGSVAAGLYATVLSVATNPGFSVCVLFEPEYNYISLYYFHSGNMECACVRMGTCGSEVSLYA